jgi:hypothetical protein
MPTTDHSTASLIEHFALVRVINTRTRRDRRRETEREFASNGFPLNTSRVAFFDAVMPESADGFPNAGVRGCYLSHLGVLEATQSAGVANVLILEDDIAFARDIADSGGQAVARLDGLDWDIAYFGHAQGSWPGLLDWKPVREAMRFAHFYAVNGKTVPRLVAFLKTQLARPPGHPDGGPMHYDGALSTFMQQNPDIKAYYCSRNLGYQRPSKTDLHDPSIIDRNSFLRRFASTYRAAKRAYWKRVR